MKFHLTDTGTQNIFTACGDGYLEVNAQRVEGSAMVDAGSITPWPVANIRNVTAADFAAVIAAHPELVLIGSGRAFQFPAPAALKPLIDARIGYEIMDTHAACRTYNVLLGEGRKVLAALIVD